MTPEEIKRCLKEKKYSVRRLARRFRTSPSSAHLLVHKKLNSARLEKRFADFLGVSVEELRGNDASQN